MGLPLTRDYVSGGAALDREDIEDILGSSFVSPLSSLDVAYDDAANAFEFDVDLTHDFNWTGRHIFDTTADGDGPEIHWPLVPSGAITGIGVGEPATEITVGAGEGFRALVFSGIYNIVGVPNGIPFLVFNFNPTIRLDNTIDFINNCQIFKSSGVIDITAAGALASVGGPFEGFLLTTQFTATGGGSASLAGFAGYSVEPTLSTGWSLQGTNEFRGFVFAPNITPTLTRIVAIDISDFTVGSVHSISLRSAGDTVQMRHAGPGVFGANAAATSADAKLEVQSTTGALLVSRMTGAQMNAIAAPVDGMIVYVNDNATVPGPGFYSFVAGAWVAGV